MYGESLKLLQEAKTPTIPAKSKETKITYVAVLTSLTMAAVLADFASLGTQLLLNQVHELGLRAAGYSGSHPPKSVGGFHMV
jgi:acetyl-CoA carboxylase beta subunit